MPVAKLNMVEWLSYPLHSWDTPGKRTCDGKFERNLLFTMGVGGSDLYNGLGDILPGGL